MKINQAQYREFIRPGLLWALHIDFTDRSYGPGYFNQLYAHMVDAMIDRYSPQSLLDLAIIIQKKSDEEIATDIGFSDRHMITCTPLLSRLRRFPIC